MDNRTEREEAKEEKTERRKEKYRLVSDTVLAWRTVLPTLAVVCERSPDARLGHQPHGLRQVW